MKAVLAGAEKMTPGSSRHPEGPPVTIQIRLMLYQDLDHSDTLDIAIFFAACCAFWCQIRLGELFSENQHNFNPKHALALHHSLPFPPALANYTCPGQKSLAKKGRT